MKIFKKSGFSIAEALITLLIVALVTVVSIPILTKKKRDISNIPHGEWTCVINESGQHASWSQDAPTPVIGNGSCEFVAPKRAKNFVIKAVGGGGGGGAGFSEQKLMTYTAGQDTTLDYTANAYYRVALVGGGGGGGGGNDERGGTRAYAGGSGGSVLFSFVPTTNISYRVSIGGGGGRGDGDDGKHSGGDGGWGGQSSFAGIIVANGGGGGGGVRYNGGPNMPGTAGGYANNDSSGSFRMLSFSGKNGTQSWQSASAITANYSGLIPSSMLKPSSYSYFGAGGYGGQGKNGHGSAGYTGYAAIASNVVTAGTRGQASLPITLPVAQINKKLVVTIGTGGKGAVNKYLSSNHTLTDPEQGKPTIVGDLVTVFGGQPGENKAISPSDYTTSTIYLAGQDGQESNFDKDQIVSDGGRKNGAGNPNSNAKFTSSSGCGGGGGGAMTNPAANTDTAGIYSGNGADGANGKVVITW